MCYWNNIPLTYSLVMIIERRSTITLFHNSFSCFHNLFGRTCSYISVGFKTSNLRHWRKSRGGGWGDVSPPPPHFFGWGGWPVQISPPPPLFEDKITLNLTFIVKKLTLLTVKLLKTPKIARSLRSLAHKCILRLDLCGFASTCILFLTSFM